MNSDKEQILNKADIVEIVSQYVTLQDKGKRQLGLCPFHKEKTPSFTVQPDRGYFHCFGCGQGGNVIDFIMAIENLTFVEALHFLGEKVGVRIENKGSKQPHQEIDRFQVMDLAAQFYGRALPAHKEASEYVKSRGLTQEQIQHFTIGYAPPGWDNLSNYLRKKKIPEKVMLELGLVVPRQKGSGSYDRFRNRIIFPIRNTIGRIIAFGGRALDPEDPAKYLNSSDSPLFNKSRVLYLLDIAKDSMRDYGAILVEGYMDAIALHLHGFEQTVASLGTALTSDHANVLKRYTRDYTLLYDGDRAGINAAKKGVETFTGMGLPVKVALLPENEDPDDFLKNRGADAMRELLNSASEGFDFYMNLGMQEADISTPKGKRELLDYIYPLLERMSDEFLREEYIRLFAQRTGGDLNAILATIQKKKQKQSKRKSQEENPASNESQRSNKNNPVKEQLIRLLAFHHNLLMPEDMAAAAKPSILTQEEIDNIIPSMVKDLWEDSHLDAFLRVLIDSTSNDNEGETEAIRLARLFPERKDLSSFLNVLEAEPLPSTEKGLHKMRDDVLYAMKQQIEKRQRQSILQKSAGDDKKLLQDLDNHFSREKGKLRESSSFF